jgi:hypothetical protein
MFAGNRVCFFLIGFLLASFGGIFYAPVQAGLVQKAAEAAKANAAAQANAKVGVKPR